MVLLYRTSSTTTNYIENGYYPDTWQGLYTQLNRITSTLGYNRSAKFSIKLNENVMPTNVPQEIRSTIAHELGHALCLGDNPSNYYPEEDNSIMNYNCNRYNYAPRYNDIYGVEGVVWY